MRDFLLFFNPILLIIVILCNLGLIHAVHFYLNGLFILLPLVQQCCYIFLYIYILVVLLYHHLYCYNGCEVSIRHQNTVKYFVLCNKRRRLFEIAFCRVCLHLMTMTQRLLYYQCQLV